MAQSTSSAATTQFTFDFGKGAVVGDFDGGDICIDGGIVLLRELDDRRGYSRRIASCISDWRTGPVKHEVEDLVRMELFMKACGYSGGIDANSLRQNAMFDAAAAQPGKTLPGQSSFSRARNNVDADSVDRMQRLLTEQ